MNCARSRSCCRHQQKPGRAFAGNTRSLTPQNKPTEAYHDPNNQYDIAITTKGRPQRRQRAYTQGLVKIPPPKQRRQWPPPQNGGGNDLQAPASSPPPPPQPPHLQPRHRPRGGTCSDSRRLGPEDGRSESAGEGGPASGTHAVDEGARVTSNREEATTPGDDGSAPRGDGKIRRRPAETRPAVAKTTSDRVGCGGGRKEERRGEGVGARGHRLRRRRGPPRPAPEVAAAATGLGFEGGSAARLCSHPSRPGERRGGRDY